MAKVHLLDHCHPGYQIRFFDRMNRTMASPPKAAEVRWGRKLDGISRASVTYILSDENCCEQLGNLESIAHKMGIYRNGALMWYGWLEDIEYLAGEAHVPAFDALGWMEKRVVHNNHDWIATDLVDIFAEIWNDAVAPDPIEAELILWNTQVFEDKSILASDFRYAFDCIKEILDSGLDVTVVGQKVIAGIVPNFKHIELRLKDFQGNVVLTKKGSTYANRIIVDANEQIQGIYPSGPPGPNSLYPLVEHVIRDAQITDQTAADNVAISRYEYSRYVPRLITTEDSIVLHPNTNVNLKDLIPGMKIIIDTEGLCYATKQEFRLGELDVLVAAGEEKVSINTQPVGVRGLFDEIEDPL